MKTIKDLLKDNNSSIIDAEKVFDQTGQADSDYLKILSEQKPLLPDLKSSDRLKYFSIKENRDRYIDFPERLLTRGLKPFPVDAHEQIGQYESKHNLYLTTAAAYNLIQDRLDDYIVILQEVANRLINLEERIAKLENTFVE